jgi:hypothetical protein
MSQATKVGVAAVVTLLASMSSPASAHGRLYPLTRCGPDLAFLCRIHGSFDASPYHYHLAIYPGCIKTARVETPYGIERHRVIVCGAPERTMLWW